jgi:hypothetical protein
MEVNVMRSCAWIPMLVCITGAVMILMARQRADETMRKTNSILGWYCWWLEQ